MTKKEESRSLSRLFKSIEENLELNLISLFVTEQNFNDNQLKLITLSDYNNLLEKNIIKINPHNCC